MKQNLAVVPSGNIPLQQQSKKVKANSNLNAKQLKKSMEDNRFPATFYIQYPVPREIFQSFFLFIQISISSNQGVSEALQSKNFQLQERFYQELGLMQDSKVKIQDQQKQRLENQQKKSQDQQHSIQIIQTVKTEEFEDDEPFQINLYSQKNFSLDRQKVENIVNTQNFGQGNSNNFDKKLQTQSSTQIQRQVIMEKNPQNKKDLIQSVQLDSKNASNSLVKSQSPKEGLRYSKSFQNNQGGSSKHKTGNTSNEMYSIKQDSFSTSIQSASQTISNPSSLIDHYKLKYLQEVEKSLSSNNTNSQNSQANEDILTQKMQLIELKKKKIFQQANNECKNLKIPLITQSLEFNNRYPTLKKNSKAQQGHKKRMSLREQTKRRKQFTDKKNVRLNKSMKASRLSTSFDLYCIYESKSEDSNDHSPQESRNRSFFFKSEKILNQLGLPSAPSSPTAEKQDEILDSSENNEEKLINTVPNSSRQEKTDKVITQTIQNQTFVKKQQKDENIKISNEQQDNNNNKFFDNSVKAPASNIDVKNQIQTKGNEQLALKNSDSNSKLKKNAINQSKTPQESQKSKINKNIPITKKSLELVSNFNKMTSPNANQNQMTQSVVTMVQNRQNSQTDRKENLRSSQLSIKQEQNNKSNSDLTKDKGNLMTNSINLVKKEQQQQLIVYDLKNHKVSNPEKLVNQQAKQKEKTENGDTSLNESSTKPKYEQDQINESEKSNKINRSCSGEIEDEEENIDGSPKGLNIINLYRKSNSQQDVPSILENQSVENQQNTLIANNQNTTNNHNQHPFKKRNSSLTSFNSPQNTNQQNFNIKFDNSSNLRNSMPKMPQVLPLSVSQFPSANKTKDFRFMTEEGTPQQNQSNGNQSNSNQGDNFQGHITQSVNLNKEQQNQKKEIKELIPQMKDSQSFKYQSDRIQVIQFDKKQSRQNNQDSSKNSSLKGRRNSLNQISGQKLVIQSTQNNPQQGFNTNYPLNALINQSNVSQVLKKSESQSAFQNSTYRDQFKQKLELKSINQNQGYNLSIYIQNNLKQFANQNSQSPKGSRKGVENLESVAESQCNSPKDARSEKLRSNISYSSISKSKAHSDLNSPEIKGQNQKLLESKKLKVVKVQPKTSQQSPAFKPLKNANQQCNSELEVLDLKANINEMYYKKSIKPSPQRNQNLWSPESQGKQISQLDTQVSHLQSTKTNPDTDNSNIIDNSKQKKNVLVSEFYKDLSTPLFVQLGNSHAHANLPQTLTQSAKNERYKNIKDEIEKISSTNTSNLRREQMQLQNNQIMSPFWGQIDLKKQNEKKELVIKPLIQEPSQQKQQQKKNKFNVESKVKSYIQAGQQNYASNSKQKEQANFHLAKGAGIINSSQQPNQINSKSLHQESLDLGKQNRESQSMFTTYETFGQVNNNGTYIDSNFVNGNIDQNEKNVEYQSNSRYNTKNEVKQNNQNSYGDNQIKQIKSSQQGFGDQQQSQLSSVEYLTQIQQQMQMQRQLANEQLQKAQQSINLIQQSIENKNAIGSNYSTLIINGKQNNLQSQK